MSNKKLKEFIIDSFDGGVNFRDIISEVPKNELSDCLNMYYNGKELKTREGLCIKKPFALTDTDCEIVPVGSVCYMGEIGYKTFLVTKKDDMAFYSKILIVKSDFSCSYINVGTFLFSKYNTKLSRINCLSLLGKASTSGGHYLLLSLYDENNNLCDKFIFELNSDFSSLNLLYAKDIYKPLVSINGKGNKYTELQTYKKTFPATRRYEDFNLLSNGFRAGFTTDGLSTSFKLPVNSLSNEENENIVVDYTSSSGASYSVQIPYNNVVSTAINIDGINCVFKIDRQNGVVFVLDKEGSETALPMSEANRNNLVITAYKQTETDSLFKMTVVENFNSRVFLAGNEEEGNKVYFSRQNNPLYFPKSNFSFFGETGSSIVALKQNNDRLLVFKPHQVGICSSISNSMFDADYIFKGGTTNKAVVEKVTIKTIKTGLGCLYPDTIMSCSNRLVFLGSDGRVYAITSSSNYTHRFYRISDKIESKLNASNFNTAFAVDHNGYYMLFVGKSCFLFDYNTSQFLSASSANGNKNSRDKIAWFYFEYEFGVAKPMLSIDFAGKSLIVAKGKYVKSNDKIYLYTFEGETDQKVGTTFKITYVDIKSSFTTGANELLKDGRKNIVGVELTITSTDENIDKKINLYYLNENKCCKVSEIDTQLLSNAENIVKKTPCIFGTRHFGVKLERDTGLKVKQIKYIYKD